MYVKADKVSVSLSIYREKKPLVFKKSIMWALNYVTSGNNHRGSRALAQRIKEMLNNANLLRAQRLVQVVTLATMSLSLAKQCVAYVGIGDLPPSISFISPTGHTNPEYVCLKPDCSVV